jgi:hypothetical protein
MLGAPVLAPPLAPSPVNLVAASRSNPDPAGVRWQQGISYTPEAGAELGTFGICPADVAPDLSAIPGLPDQVDWLPYAVWAAIECRTVGIESIDWQGRLDRAYAVALPKALEHELWTGELAQAGAPDYPNIWLASPRADDVTPAGGPVSVKAAIGHLEQALADCGLGARGMIHMAAVATPHYTGARREGNLLLTPRDTILLPGTGYPGTGPTGAPAAAGTTWLYATGRTDVRYTDAQYPVRPDQTGWLALATRAGENRVRLYALGEAVASWDGICHFAINATLDT